jgi:hypothetical protein
MSDEDVWQLIFSPGFSTAEAVTDVSGRGVGMDVVKRNITAMGGVVDIRSLKGFGTTISISLPLTLAILDGMSIKRRRRNLHPATGLCGGVAATGARGCEGNQRAGQGNQGAWRLPAA